MVSRLKTTLFASALALFLLAGAHAQESPRFPFVLPWDDAEHSVVDVGALNPTPAGGNGFIAARDGHFYDEKGNRVRFLGVNMAASANFPDKTDADKVAAHLHKLGVNIVRLHHMDSSFYAPNIFDAHYKDRQHLDPDQLDRLDYFVSQLKRQGIYVDVNLHVGREFTAADGLPDTDKLPEQSKIVNYFMPRMIELQRSYARDLLTHLNPYTQTRYTDEPAVALIEINNENTLLGAAWDSNALEKLPPAYKTELARQWNAWLKKKYETTDGLKRAWSAEDKPFGPNLLANSDFSRGAEHWNLELFAPPAGAKMQLPEDVAAPQGVVGHVLRVQVAALGAQNWHIQLHQTGLDLTEGEPYTVTFWAKADKARSLSVYASVDQDDYHHIGLDGTASLTPTWRKFTFAFTAARTLKNHNRLSFVLGDALGTVDLAGITLRPGSETEFPPEASLEKGTVPFGQPLDNPGGRDWIAFLMDTERAYLTTMRDYIKTDLKAHACVTGSQTGWGGLGGARREWSSDYADMHAYWQHPDFPHKPWDPVDWRIPNTSMVRDADGGTLPRLARYRLAGKPYTVSEYNHPAPNDFQAECVPMLAAFAALQGWDGIFLFDYNADRATWKSDKIKGFFDIDSNPAKTAFLPAAAMLFLRDDMAVANGELRLRIPEDDVSALMAKNGMEIDAEWEAAGIHPRDALNKRLSVSFAPGKKPAGSSEQTAPPKKNDEIINAPSEKGPLDWKIAGTEKPVFTADSPSSKVMVGFLSGQSVQLPGWLVQMGETPSHFAALMLSAVDGKPMEQSKSLLLTVVGRVENTGMHWNADRTSVGDQWGTGPTVAEGVPAQITIRTLAASAEVYALDGTGKRTGKVDSKLTGQMLTFAVGPAAKTLWYEIDASSAVAEKAH